MVDQVFPPIGKDGFDPDFRIQVSKKVVLTIFSTVCNHVSSNPGVLHLWILEGWVARDQFGRFGRNHTPESGERTKDMNYCQVLLSC